ncbi:hydrogen peroxide-inducible genes activator [Roseicella aerolata]|uniref:Hydrogen peroxide-inducible genes activator n=1 Tax=Roseicella aerolata TaxID=2883479 RepID=A0A9X1I941_9PROT|nr:hydrogen peroxide-inducible genes activator [Roseicella aerolata]MCB4820545.1 hydrogen peroxide-inducible genes activator [Roseicella aerolata]
MKVLPTLRQLRYLVAVVERCHFGQAAEACLVSQSTLSAGIQELEELLGAPLLERTKRSVVPTPLGREIAARAKALLTGAEELVDAAQAAKEPMAGPLHLGVIPTVGPFLVPRAMPALRAAFPALKLYLREDQTVRLLAQLNAGELDTVVLALPFPTEDVETLEIARDRFWVVCPPGHRLCSAQAASAADMAPEDLLLLEDGHCLRDHALAACALEGGRRSAAFQGTSLHTLVQMVANGLGVTLLPEMALEAGILRGLEVSALPLSGEAPWRRIGLAWRRSSGRKETFRRLAAALQAEMEPRPPPG